MSILLVLIFSYDLYPFISLGTLFVPLFSMCFVDICTDFIMIYCITLLVVVIPTRKTGRFVSGGGGGSNNAVLRGMAAPTSITYQDTSPTSPLQQLLIMPMRSVFGGGGCGSGSGGGNNNTGSSYFKFSNSLSDDVRKRLRFKNGE